jgi:cytochrome o ubiquinol oxidase subunit 2
MKQQSKGKRMTRRQLVCMGVAIVFGLAIAGLGLYLLIHDKNIAVLNPQGLVADQQRDLIVFTTLLGMLVVVPVFIMLFVIAWRYREGGRATYTPSADHNVRIEALWWGIPIAIILVLSVVTWVTTHQLDPYKPLVHDKQPIRIQVVALQWKWLFLYPDRQIATVNEVRFPKDTPVNFELTADSPMSAFWIPSLGSQTYAMNGMTAKLSLQAHEVGEYHGSNTNISGEGYAGMNFKAISTTHEEFDEWVKNLANMDSHLDWAMYEQLAQPSKDVPVTYYMLHDTGLYDKIMAKYMGYGGGEQYGQKDDHGGH